MLREEAIRILEEERDVYIPKWIKYIKLDFFDRRWVNALELAIKALEKESVLDKIRAEITNIPITDTDGHNNNWYREPQAIINDVLQIIDKYKAEGDKE